jgi:ElaB/YqjD/DUF883 family membrane-anchored ribosome-binding protein
MATEVQDAAGAGIPAQHASAYADPLPPHYPERNHMHHDTTPDTQAPDAVALAASALQRAGLQADAMAQRGASALNHGAEALQRSANQLQARAQQVSHHASAYVQREPVKAVLMAAATGAALMALLTLMARSRGTR